MPTENNPASRSRDAAAGEAVFAELFAVNPLPAVVSRLQDHVLVAVNARAAEVFGVSPEAAVGRRVTDFYVDPDDCERLTGQLRREGRADGQRLLIRAPGRRDRSAASNPPAWSRGRASRPCSRSSPTSTTRWPPKRD